MRMEDVIIERGIRFNEQEHRYFYGDKELSGVTGIIGARVGKVFSPEARKLEKVMSYAYRGSRIHALAEEYFREGKEITDSKDALYIKKVVDALYPPINHIRVPEMLVSDKETVATAIDLVVVKPDGTAAIFDYKTGNFYREYCSWQLGFGKYLFELEGNIKVTDAFVIATKEPFMYRITPKDASRVIGRIEAFKKQNKR